MNTNGVTWNLKLFALNTKSNQAKSIPDTGTEMSASASSHGLWLNSSVHVWKTERRWDGSSHKHHSSIWASWLSVPRHTASRQKAYQCKTKCISLRRKDIENETGESTKPNGILCEAFQISADMQSINIQLGCVMFCFYIFVCLWL